jgi:hypothetical protein
MVGCRGVTNGKLTAVGRQGLLAASSLDGRGASRGDKVNSLRLGLGPVMISQVFNNLLCSSYLVSVLVSV